MTEPVSLEPSIALCAYAEPLASHRRVLVFGNSLSALSVQLLERGARSVHVCDPDALRVAEATARNRSTQISFSSLADSDLSLQAGAFELSLIDDLGAFDAVSVVKKAKRAVGPRGVALVACPNAEASTPLLRSSASGNTSLDYYALYDVVAAEFEHVRMLGQTPFVGYAIADFSASGEPEPALDTSFVPGGAEEPDLFIALASNHEVRLDEFSVIQLPTKRLLGSLARPAAPAPLAAPAPSESAAKARDTELARLNQWIKELESRASTADERADHAETELEELRAKLDAERAMREADRAKSEGERAKLDAERAKREDERTKQQEAERAKGDAERAKQQEDERGRLEADRVKREDDRARLEADRVARAAAKATQDKELAVLRQQLAERDHQLAERDRQLAAQRSEVEQASKSDLAELERQLVERGAEVRRLEQGLRTAERTGRELVRELARSSAESGKSANAELERAVAEREADLQAATWTIESLSLRLELLGQSGAPDARPPETASVSDEAR